MKDINSKIQQMIIDKLGVPESAITDKASFYDDLGVDSLDFVEFIVSVEKSFNIIIEDEVYPKLKSVGALVKFIDQKVNASQVPQLA
jgi:acyl carrier protein